MTSLNSTEALVRARIEMTRLAHEHDLAFTANPGGGEFYRLSDGFRCQITAHDEIADLAKLRKALKYEERIRAS